MSSTYPALRRCIHAAFAALALFLSHGSQAQTEQNMPDPFAVVPFNDPLILQQLASLDDRAFLNQLFGSATGPALLEQFYPSGLNVFPLSHGFAGVQDTCLRMRSVLACRLYVNDLINIDLRNAQQPGVYTDPFASQR